MLGLLNQSITHGDSFIYPLQDAFIIEICIRNSAEQSIRHKDIHFFGDRTICLAQNIGNDRDTSNHKQQQVHSLSRMTFFSTYTFQYTAGSFGCLLTLITKHVRFHILIHLKVYIIFP